MARRQRTIDPVTREPIVLDGPNATALPPTDMPEYPPPETRLVHERVPEVMRVRGGFSFGAILTGMLTAFGVMLVLSAIVGAIAASTSLNVGNVDRGDATALGIGAGVAFVIAQFIAYFWGGYTAGRMARGKGMIHGLLVPILAAVVAGITALIVMALGSDARMAMPFGDARFPIDQDTVYTIGAAIGIGAIAAMLLGGALGGAFGARWHTKLERRAASDRYYDESSDDAV